MEPVSLAILFVTGALMGTSYRSWRNDGDSNEVVIRPIFAVQPTGYLANELCSLEALRQTGELLELDLVQYAPKVSTGFFRVVAMTKPGAPLKHQVIAIFKSTGPGDWSLSEAYRAGYRRVSSPRDFEQATEVLEVLNEPTLSKGELPNLLPEPVMHALPVYDTPEPQKARHLETYLRVQSKK